MRFDRCHKCHHLAGGNACLYFTNLGYKLIAGINISAKQFDQDKIVDVIKSAINDTKIDPHFLELELTESAIDYYAYNWSYGLGRRWH